METSNAKPAFAKPIRHRRSRNGAQLTSRRSSTNSWNSPPRRTSSFGTSAGRCARPSAASCVSARPSGASSRTGVFASTALFPRSQDSRRPWKSGVMGRRGREVEAPPWSDEHASSAGHVLSLIASARLHRLDPERYLTDLIRADLVLGPNSRSVDRRRAPPQAGPVTFPGPVGRQLRLTATDATEEQPAGTPWCDGALRTHARKCGDLAAHVRSLVQRILPEPAASGARQQSGRNFAVLHARQHLRTDTSRRASQRELRSTRSTALVWLGGIETFVLPIACDAP